jgi:hypothetical protein
MPFFYPQLLQNINRKKAGIFIPKRYFLKLPKKKQNSTMQ